MSFELRFAFSVGGRDLALDTGHGTQVLALVGPSGAGKTSVLNCVAGLRRPSRGRIAVSGRVLFDSDRGMDLQPERRGAGYVFQDARLFPHLRVRGNLRFGERYRPRGEEGLESFGEMAAFLGIDHLLDRWPATLSGGEARRVAIGRALLSSPQFLLLDEPFASLDPARAEEIRGLVERIRDELGLPILLVSHDRADVERLAQEVVTLA